MAEARCQLGFHLGCFEEYLSKKEQLNLVTYVFPYKKPVAMENKRDHLFQLAIGCAQPFHATNTNRKQRDFWQAFPL